MPMSNACGLIVVSYKNLLKPAPAAGKAWQSFYFQERRIQQLAGGRNRKKTLDDN
jgi:hypothetical protein